MGLILYLDNGEMYQAHLRGGRFYAPLNLHNVEAFILYDRYTMKAKERLYVIPTMDYYEGDLITQNRF